MAPSVDLCSAVRAAQYVRMSTDTQDLSIPMQEQANAAYAASRGYTVVATYKDEGESGLSLENRPGLKQLLADAIVGGLDYDALLIFDVSRWRPGLQP